MTTILLAEDEQVLRESLAGLLESEGFTLHHAATGVEAYHAMLCALADGIGADTVYAPVG